MKSLELLQLRRDRMAHASPLIDRNQALILSIPDLFARLLLLLHTMNHAPALHELSMFHVTAQHHLVENITAFAALGHNTGWDALQTTLDIAGPPSVAPYTPATPSTPGENGGGVADGGNANTMNDIDDDDDDDDDASATAAAASNTVQYMLRTLAPLIRNSVRRGGARKNSWLEEAGRGVKWLGVMCRILCVPSCVCVTLRKCASTEACGGALVSSLARRWRSGKTEQLRRRRMRQWQRRR